MITLKIAEPPKKKPTPTPPPTIYNINSFMANALTFATPAVAYVLWLKYKNGEISPSIFSKIYSLFQQNGTVGEMDVDTIGDNNNVSDILQNFQFSNDVSDNCNENIVEFIRVFSVVIGGFFEVPNQVVTLPLDILAIDNLKSVINNIKSTCDQDITDVIARLGQSVSIILNQNYIDMTKFSRYNFVMELDNNMNIILEMKNTGGEKYEMITNSYYTNWIPRRSKILGQLRASVDDYVAYVEELFRIIVFEIIAKYPYMTGEYTPPVYTHLDLMRWQCPALAHKFDVAKKVITDIVRDIGKIRNNSALPDLTDILDRMIGIFRELENFAKSNLPPGPDGSWQKLISDISNKMIRNLNLSKTQWQQKNPK